MSTFFKNRIQSKSLLTHTHNYIQQVIDKCYSTAMPTNGIYNVDNNKNNKTYLPTCCSQSYDSSLKL